MKHFCEWEMENWFHITLHIKAKKLLLCTSTCTRPYDHKTDLLQNKTQIRHSIQIYVYYGCHNEIPASIHCSDALEWRVWTLKYTKPHKKILKYAKHFYSVKKSLLYWLNRFTLSCYCLSNQRSAYYGEHYMSHVSRKPVLVICEQQRCRSACTFVQSDQHHCCSLPG